ncbi:hypothetical protein ACEUEG_01290 [Aeromonas media]|uniref:hypothetical protein n=1 Tax=Aeromonas TaxID=642 RepID=UPI001FFDA09D|nr:hypothetical protein [Aeromonas genomosp. paramedia]MCK2082825.1 hypothetical protein [Aeromonas genomosp. paramedia]
MTDYVNLFQWHAVQSLSKAQSIVLEPDPLSIWHFSFFERAKSIGKSAACFMLLVKKTGGHGLPFFIP